MIKLGLIHLHKIYDPSISRSPKSTRPPRCADKNSKKETDDSRRTRHLQVMRRKSWNVEARNPRVIETRYCAKIACKIERMKDLKGCEENKWEPPIYTHSQNLRTNFPAAVTLVQKTRKLIITADIGTCAALNATRTYY